MTSKNPCRNIEMCMTPISGETEFGDPPVHRTFTTFLVQEVPILLNFSEHNGMNAYHHLLRAW